MNFARAQTRRVVALVAALFGVAVIESAIASAAQDTPPLEQRLTKEEQAKRGIASMSPERMFRQGHRAAQQGNRSGGVVAGADVVETQVNGDFHGWTGATIIKLSNGQVWQQIEYHYEYHYAYMPKALIYPSGGGHKMRVDGTSKPIGVQRLR
jgi:hypothetical protein